MGTDTKICAVIERKLNKENSIDIVYKIRGGGTVKVNCSFDNELLYKDVLYPAVLSGIKTD